MSLLLQQIGEYLDKLPGYDSILGKIQMELNEGSSLNRQGRPGMRAEEVLRALILKMLNNYSYRQLEHVISDSASAREFLKLSPFSSGFKYKTLQSNIKQINEATLDLLNAELKNYAQVEGIEDGAAIRTDAFNTESNIHYPTDWSLMNDSIRVLSRLLCYAVEDLKIPLEFTNHYRASKKKLFKINNDKSYKRRRKLNLELIRLTRKTVDYADDALVVMKKYPCTGSSIQLASIIAALNHFIPLVENVVSQAHRRIVKGEKVPSSEKIVSIFEEHTDIISKGSRNVVFGHKNTITTGKSGLVLSVDIHDGNPADSTLVKRVVNTHVDFYKSIPKSAVFDGCYSSQENRDFAENISIDEVCFSKETDEQSSLSRAKRKKLRNFRAGIEATVSMLMRMFGLKRIMNKGIESFRATVKAAVVTYNLFILSRTKLTT